MDEQGFVKQTSGQIPQANAKRIVRFAKESGKITGYKLSDKTFVSKPDAVSMANQGQITGGGITYHRDTEFLKSIPDGSEKNNLGNLPSVSPQS